MADLLVRNIPDDIVRTYEARAIASGEALEKYVGDVLVGRRPAVTTGAIDRSALVALTRKNLARFDRPLEPMAREQFREGFEE